MLLLIILKLNVSSYVQQSYLLLKTEYYVPKAEYSTVNVKSATSKAVGRGQVMLLYTKGLAAAEQLSLSNVKE